MIQNSGAYNASFGKILYFVYYFSTLFFTCYGYVHDLLMGI
jgi:hypothetical protein